MRTDIKMVSWANVDDECPMQFWINGENDIDLLLGDRCDGLEMTISIDAMERLIDVAGQALAQAKQQAGAESAE